MFDINEVVDYLNQNYNQQREEDIPNIDVYDKETIIAFWGCGAFVLHQDIITDIYEDDGHWFADTGYSILYNKDWLDSKITAYNHLKEYLKEHGYPEYSVIHVDEFGQKEYWKQDVCGYSLIDKKEKPFQKYTSLPFFDVEIKECDIKLNTNSLRHQERYNNDYNGLREISFISLTSYKEEILSKKNYTLICIPDNKKYRKVYQGCWLNTIEKYNEDYSRYIFRTDFPTDLEIFD